MNGATDIQAAEALRRGELLILPTETVYGLAADASNADAVAAIFEAKGRPRFNPLIAIPVTGWLASSAGGREIEWFGLFQWPLLPVGGGREAAKGYMNLHELAMYGLYGLIALHVLAALKHQFINRDNVLHRMIPLIPRRP